MRKKPASLARQAFMFGLLISLAGLTIEPALEAAPTNNFHRSTWASVDRRNPALQWF
jgi:hypothetical protein